MNLGEGDVSTGLSRSPTSMLGTLFPAQRALLSGGGDSHVTKHVPAHVTSFPQPPTPRHSWPRGAPSAARPRPPGPLECHGTPATFCSGHRPAAAVPRGHEGGPGPEPSPSWQRGLRPTHAPGQPSGTRPAPPPAWGSPAQLPAWLSSSPVTITTSSVTCMAFVTQEEVTPTRSCPPASCLQVPARREGAQNPHGDVGPA